MKYLIVLTFLFFSFPVTNVYAQPKDIAKYRKESEEMRKQVWAWDKPQFKVKNIPAQYANASKVIIARHTDLTADSKSKLAFYGFGFGAKKEQTLTEVVREVVKINDKSAINDYSELSFTQFQKSSGLFVSDKTTSFVGVRVIKSDGSVKEINADDIVLTKDESAEKKAKVAIPDLQAGDILDYFIATEEFMTNSYGNRPYMITLFDDAPVLSLSFHAQLGKKYAIEYRSYNDAPELAVSKNNDDDIVVDVEKDNIPPFETSLWVAPGLQLPFIRMNISLGYKGIGSRAMNTRKPGEVSKNKSSDEFLEEKGNSLSSSYYSGYWMKAAKAEYDDIESDAKSKAKQSGINYKDLPDEEKAALLFYTLRFTKLINFDINNLAKTLDIGSYRFNSLAFPLFCTFKAAGIDPAILISTERTGFRMKEIMSSSDLITTAYLPAAKKFFSIETVYDAPMMTPGQVEGLAETKSCTFDHPAAIMSMKKMEGLANIAPGPRIPVSSSDKNARIENLKLALTPEKNNLAVRRSSTLKGFYKADVQKQLVLYEDFYEAERKAFKEEKSLIEELEDGKKTKKFAEEAKNAFAGARKKQKDAFIKEAKDWFELEVTNLNNYKTDTLGIRHTAPNFVYSSSFNLEGLVKKAGNNIIIEIGKVQGKPLVVNDEQRKRAVDVFMPFARSIEYNVELEVPDGYTAEGVAALNKRVENAAGLFIAEASATDKLVIIKIKKHYLHNFEPVGNWEQLLQFMDASNDWVNAKLLLKKK